MKKRKDFVIYGQGRSGSTLLVDLLNCHDLIRCEGEIFGEQVWKSVFQENLFKLVQRFPYTYLNSKLLKASNKSYGFKLLSYQTPNVDNFLDHLRDKGWLVIYIRRKSIFKMAISSTIAQKYNKWTALKEERVYPDKILLDKYEFCGALSWIMKNEGRIQKNLSYLTHHTVTYEEDLENEQTWSKTCNLIFDLLEIPHFNVASKYRKTDPRPYEERITNYDELVGIAQSLGLTTR